MEYAFCFKNLKTMQQTSHNCNAAVPSASMIKIFIASCAMEKVSKKLLSLEQTFYFNELCDQESTIKTGKPYTLTELLSLMLQLSDNPSTNLFIGLLGMEEINMHIRSLGMNSTSLKRKMLDFKAREEGKENLTSAGDISSFLELLYNGKIVNPESSRLLVEIMKGTERKMLMGYFIPKDIPIAHKTGNLPAIEHNAGIVFTQNGDYIFTMLTWDSQNPAKSAEAIALKSKEVFDRFIKNMNIDSKIIL